MAELELIGPADDGEHLVLASSDGTRFTLRIDEPLRAAVRRNRPQLEQLRAADAGTMPPREIQAHVRAGLSAEEVAELGGASVAQVRRYEGPVLAEREFVATQARSTRVGRDTDAPVLGDLVTDRLAARHVDTAELAWDAWRPVGGPWHVSVSYDVGTEARRATWTFDQGSRTLTAVDDEGRWLSETRIVDEPVRRHLEPVRSRVFDAVPYDQESDPRGPATGAADADDPTAALLDDLSTRRGVRQEIDLEVEEPEDVPAGADAGTATPDQAVGASAGASDDDVPEDTVARGGARLYSLAARSRAAATTLGAPGTDLPDAEVDVPSADGLGGAAPGADAPAEHGPAEHGPAEDGLPRRDDGEAPTLDIAVDAPAPVERARPRGTKGRPKVPSWDEIVFGARTDD